MWQEVPDHEGQIVEGEVGSLAQQADHRALLGGGLPGQVMRSGGAVEAVGGATLAPFADGLGADAVALCQQAGRRRGAGNLGANGRGGAGIWVDLVHGSPPSQDSAWQALEPALVV